MRFGSLFSGIEAASVAWKPLGWQCQWVAEIDPFACALLAHRYPEVLNLGDVNEIDADAIESVDLIVFGSPCQSFSVAGKRLGLDDPRGNMALVGLRVVGRIRPRWVVWENVPGVLSSDGGRDFGTFIGLLGELGYGFAYRVLDAQFAGVPQRRRRVFVVGYLGDWRPAAAVLFEPKSLRGDPPPRREAGQGVARCIEPSAAISSGHGYWNGSDVGAAVRSENQTESTLITHSLRADGLDAGEDGTGRGTPLIPILEVGKGSSSRGEGPNGAGIGRDGDPMYTLQAGAQHAVAGPLTLAIRGRGDSHDLEWREDGTANAILTPNGGRAGIGVGAVAFDPTARQPEWSIDRPLKTDGPLAVASGMSVRRLTPRECERLQGFPDDYTLVPYRGKPAADGNRYRAIGNSMAVPVMHWIGHRIDAFEKAMQPSAKDCAA